ncbi:hypothetical protein TREES_T100005152 [Tupaia chinensis]|uniref:Uncharacterized protein n=1 Tax=Tupaia chinensis TaxID=246437 RepID=L9L0S1_TUPCH|nr:hypothetical protein TREES_T100005152 [Tupaia chinensis]
MLGLLMGPELPKDLRTVVPTGRRHEPVLPAQPHETDIIGHASEPGLELNPENKKSMAVASRTESSFHE